MNEALLTAALPALVRAGWDREPRSVQALGGGMNSATATVELDEGRFVAKWVRGTTAGALDAGSAVAGRLATAGLAAGEPLLTAAGQLSFAVPTGGSVALLRHVSGEPLTGSTDQEQRLMATALARVHAVDAVRRRSGPFLADLLELTHDVEPWIRPAVTTVLAEYARLPPLTWGILHADPTPEAFRYDEDTGRVGIIDWAGSCLGPLLYDVASAVMYLGGPVRATAFWTGYVEASPAAAAELHAHLDAFSRYRAAVQAAYFSMRLATTDLTGITDQSENWKGLRDGQQMLASYGVPTT